MRFIRKIKRIIRDIIDVLFISLFGIVGLIFIFTTPLKPPEDRGKSLQRRLKECIQEIKNSLLDIGKGNNVS